MAGQALGFVYRHTLGAMWTQLKAAASDYAAVFSDMAATARQKPLRTAAKLTAVGSFAYVCSVAPSERDYLGRLAEAELDLIECGPLANPQALQQVRQLRQLVGQERMDYYHLGPVSLMVVRPEGRAVRTFSATYHDTFWESLQHLQQQTVDVGFWHKWHRIEETMKDYDLPAE